MATHIEAIIPDALFDAASAVSLPSGWGKAYEGVDYNTTDYPTGYVRFSVLKNTPRQMRIRFGNEPIRVGILQASVFAPEGKGIIAASEVAGTIATAFARGSKITSGDVVIRIDDEPVVGSAIQEPAWVQIPVSIPYIVYP